MAAPPKPTAQIREEWNRRADHYAQSVVSMTSKIYAAMLPFLQLAEVQTVVEAACGPGNGVELLRQHIPPTARVLANDISARFVEIVRGKGLPNVEVVEAVNETLPYPDGCADRYVANMSLHIVEFPERQVAEAYRLLKPGGIAAFSIVGERSKSTVVDLNLLLREKYSSSQYRSFFHLSDPSSFKHLIQSAGFHKVFIFEELSYLPGLDANTIVEKMLMNPLNVELYEGLEEDGKRRYREDLQAYMQEVLANHPLGVHARIAIAFKPLD